MKVSLSLEYDDYNPSDPSEFVFKRRGGGWIDREELLRRIEDALDKAVALMDDHESITFKIEVQ